MASDLHSFGGNGLGVRENTKLDFEMRSLVGRDRWKAVVVKGSGAGGFHNGAVERAGGQHVADAPPKLSAQIKRSKDAAMFVEVGAGGVVRNVEVLQRGANRIVR